MQRKLPHVDTTVKEMQLPSNLSEEAKHFIDSTVRVTLGKPLKLNFQHETSLLMVNGSSSGSADLLPLILVMFLRGQKDCTKLVERLTSTHPNLNVSPLNYGRDNENAVAKFYSEYQERHGHPGIKVFPCGLVINPKYSWLGASPDKNVYDPTSNPVFGGLEIKCIESGKGMTPLQHIWLRKSLNLAKRNNFA